MLTDLVKFMYEIDLGIFTKLLR